MKQTDYISNSDQELAGFIQTGNANAFSELHKRYFHKMLAFAMRWLGHEAEAQDAVQEVFIVLWEKKEKIDPEKALAGLLFKVLRFQVLTCIRRDKNRQDYLKSFAQFIDIGTAEADERLREKELENIIQSAVDGMPHKMREIFVLSRKHHLSYKEIAEQLRISENTVKKQVSRGLHKQRLLIDKFFPLALIMFLEMLRR